MQWLPSLVGLWPTTFHVYTLLPAWIGRGRYAWLFASENLSSFATMWINWSFRLKLLARPILIVLVLQWDYKCVLSCKMHFTEARYINFYSDFLSFTFLSITKGDARCPRTYFIARSLENLTGLRSVYIAWISACFKTWLIFTILSNIYDSLSVAH
jgi:hypothetical protein